MSSPATVRINRKAVDRLHMGHVWIFASDVTDRGQAQPGDAVRVVDPQSRTLGMAHYSSTSQITLRMLSARHEAIDAEFLFGRLRAALAYRERYLSNSDAYRLVHAEGDLLPGLIVDRYGDYLVLQLLDQGMDCLTGDIVAALTRLLEPKGIIARNDVAVRSKEELPLEVRVLFGAIPDSVEVNMNGLRWHADLVHGQKTGIFLDQRENYVAAARYTRGRVLDCFSATGGFAIHCASHCDSVEAVDSSGPALEMAKKNALTNDVGNVEFRQADVLNYLPSMVSSQRRFDMVIIDPPAFTKSRSALESAARGYKEINLRALRLLQSGGILVSCSCSHHMSEGHLLETIGAAALDAGKQLRVLERRTQSQDHPILLTVPETHYLKCLIFEVI